MQIHQTKPGQKHMKDYSKSSSLSSTWHGFFCDTSFTRECPLLVSTGHDLFCLDTSFTRECLVFNATLVEIFLVILTQFVASFVQAIGDEHDTVAILDAERSGTSLLCKAKGVDLRSTFLLGWCNSFFCSLGLIMESTGTSFPSTWFVKTKVTFKISKSNQIHLC
jgi:hypothetical protein